MRVPGHGLIFAHRGDSKQAAENTKTAFEQALERPIDGIETDVQLSSDEVAVLWHDRFLDKIGLPGRRIDDFSYEALRRMDFAGYFSAAASSESIMSLQEFLAAYRSRCRLLIEIKNRDWEEVRRHQLKVRKTLELVGPVYDGSIMVSSFHLASLIYAHACVPEFPLVYNLDEGIIPAGLADILSGQGFLYGLCLPIASLDEAVAGLVKQHGKYLAVYTCNSDEEIDKALILGADIVISDDPQKALRRRDACNAISAC